VLCLVDVLDGARRELVEEVLNERDRPDFAAAWDNRVDACFGSTAAHYLGLEDLVRAKENAGREQDRADLVALRRVTEVTGE